MSLAWMNTCGATPPTATNTSPSSWTSLPYETVAVPPGSWTWSRAAPSRFSKPGWPPALTRGANALRSSRWMDSPGSKAQPPKNSPARGQSWTPSTSCTWLATPWMSAADAFSKNSTTGAGVPPTPYTRPAGCLHTRSCLLTPRQQHQILDLFASDYHVALEVTWSVYQNITWRLS